MMILFKINQKTAGTSLPSYMKYEQKIFSVAYFINQA